MNEKATVSSAYRMQLGMMAVFILFWSLWFLYDGHWGYPAKRQIAREFAEFKQKGREREWKEHADKKGWPDGTDGDIGYDYSDSDIFTQKLIGFGLLPIGLMYGFSFARSYGRWIAVEDGALVTSHGQRMPFDAVTTLNKSRWRSKGIVVAHYQDTGRSRRLVLDSYKYTKSVIADMVKQVESHIGPDQIVGGTPEPLPESAEDLTST